MSSPRPPVPRRGGRRIRQARRGPLVSGGLDWTHPSRAGYYGRFRSLISETMPLEDCLLEDPIEVMFTGGVARMRELIAHLATAPGADRYAVSFVEYGWRDFVLVDVLGAGVTKGTTLAEWARALGVTRDGVMAVGDNYNDREMLEYAGTGVAMGNSVPESTRRRVSRHRDQRGGGPRAGNRQLRARRDYGRLTRRARRWCRGEALLHMRLSNAGLSAGTEVPAPQVFLPEMAARRGDVRLRGAGTSVPADRAIGLGRYWVFAGDGGRV